MFLRPNESIRLSIYSFKKYIVLSNTRNFHLTHCAYLRNVSSSRRKVAGVREKEDNPSVAGEFSVSVPPKNVNDNFFGIESDVGVIEIKSKPSSNNSASTQSFKNVEQEKFITTTFGTVRYDSENKPKYHGQLEKEKVLVSSNSEKDKIRNLSQNLLKENFVGHHNVLSNKEISSSATVDILDRNSESYLTSSSYVDELYFRESYTENNNAIARLESSQSSSNDNKLNFIEESYFNEEIASESISKHINITSERASFAGKNHSSIHDKSTECAADLKLSSPQAISESKNSPSSSVGAKSNFIEEGYFKDEMANEYIFKNNNMTSENTSNTDKQSSYFDDDYFNTISDGNLKNVDDINLKSVTEIDNRIEKKSKQENFKLSLKFEKGQAIENNLHDNESESKVTSRETKSPTENFLSSQEVKTDIKTSYNLSKHIGVINPDNNGEQFPLEWNNPSFEELEGYNKFMPSTGNLTKKKNNFLLQSNEFLKRSELMNSKVSSRVKKFGSFQRNLDETDTAEETRNEEVIKSSHETQTLKVQKEANIKNSNADEQPETAYDFVKKLRSTKEKLGPELINGKFVQKSEQYDSKGFRILKNQVPDLKYYTRDEILEVLVKNVLYSDDDLIVLNKPYNLVMHESKTSKDPCLSQYLNCLAAELDKKSHNPKLITVHRLDKETTGCLLLARNEISAQRLLSFFSQRKVIKTYWIVTTRVPDPLEGVIDMPISEGFVGDRARMVLNPDLPKDIPYQNHSKSGKRAVTHYKVIAESGNAALVEAKPETGIKHQIRVHFGFGLSCPILGDHKYSHLDKLAPQKLQSDILQRLHVRQSKVRHIPMHIYARSVFIPQYRDGKNLYVMAPMPVHMSKNLQKLKFKKN